MIGQRYVFLVNGVATDLRPERMRPAPPICDCGSSCSAGHCREQFRHRWDAHEGHRGDES